MLERLALVLALGALVAGAYILLRQRHLRQMQPAPAAGRPALLYFRADHCAVCPTQARYVDEAAALWGDRLMVELVDVTHDPETAARYRVMTLPTTILLDSDGRARHVNYGLADAHKLSRQVAAVVAPLETTEPGLARPAVPPQGAS